MAEPVLKRARLGKEEIASPQPPAQTSNVLAIPELLRLQRPPPGSDSGHEKAWTDALTIVAERLLNETTLFVGGQPHRIIECEAYVQTERSGEHYDPFVHGDEMQKGLGQWYFHRSGKSYKGGTYKGLDVAFSDDKTGTFAGMLIRSLENEASGVVVEGSCRCVDYILSCTGKSSIEDLVASDVSFDFSCSKTKGDKDLLYLAHEPRKFKKRTVLRTPRVGLSLKVRENQDLRLDYVGRNYRFVTRPESITKGRIHSVCALLAEDTSLTVPELMARCGGTEKAMTQYVKDFKLGFTGDHSPSKFVGKALKTGETVQMLAFVKHRSQNVGD